MGAGRYRVGVGRVTHYAFGGITEAANGDWVVLVRKGTNHLAGGNLVQVTSSDAGATWSTESTIIGTAKDFRDAEVERLANDTLICSYFERTAGGSDFIAYCLRSSDHGSTWGSPVAITAAFTSYTAVSAKIVEVAGGDLLAPLYGSDGSGDYATLSKSTDGGDTWAHFATIASGGGRVWQEPNVVLADNGNLYCALRSDTGTHGIYISVSTDNGATWSSPTRLFNGSGRPSLGQASNGDLILASRDGQSSSGRPLVRFSDDYGSTWPSLIFLHPSPQYVYGSFLPVGLDVVMAWSHEAGSDADLFLSTFERME